MPSNLAFGHCHQVKPYLNEMTTGYQAGGLGTGTVKSCTGSRRGVENITPTYVI